MFLNRYHITLFSRSHLNRIFMQNTYMKCARGWDGKATNVVEFLILLLRIITSEILAILQHSVKVFPFIRQLRKIGEREYECENGVHGRR